ncbi:MAG TPA: hypothetical protein VF546_05920 [Pyrinomonadaceae bacterium]
MSAAHEQAARRLCQNLDVVLRMYERGFFEYDVAQRPDGVLVMPDSDPPARPPSPPPGGGQQWRKLEVAAGELNGQARALLPALGGLRGYAERELYTGGVQKRWRSLDGFQNLVKAVYRAQIVYYELKDAFLRPTPAEAETFRGYAEELMRGVDAGGDYRRVGENIQWMFRRDTALDWDEALSEGVPDEFLLLGLCGLNAYYRLHSTEAYTRGLKLLQPLEQYTRHPHRQRKKRESLGLLGLTAYLRGRLKFGLGQYAEARAAWIESSECYARKIEQKQALLGEDDERQRQKWEDTRALCLRRGSLAAAMGNGYLLLVLSKLNACLEVVVLSRAVLTKHCGRVYAAYVDLIYASAQRAKYSSDAAVLAACEQRLQACLRTFSDLVGDSHYVQRANIELGLVYHYKAKILARRLREEGLSPAKTARAERQIKKLYDDALANLTAAIEYAGESEDGRERNPRMLAEAYALRSHLWRHRPEDDYKRATYPGYLRALQDASAALKHVGKMTQLECEARMALGAAYLSIAEDLKRGKLPLNFRQVAERKGVPVPAPRPAARRKELPAETGQAAAEAELWAYKQQADGELSEALRLNDGANPRISAVCYLRLAQSGLLLETTLPDAWYYFGLYQEIAGRVEHAFCHEQAVELEKELRRKGKFFFLDVRKGLNLHEWEKKLRDYLISEAINRKVKEMKRPAAHGDDQPPPAEHGPPGQKKTKRGRKETNPKLTPLIQGLMTHLMVVYNTAEKIAKEREQEFFNKLKADSKYPADEPGPARPDS